MTLASAPSSSTPMEKSGTSTARTTSTRTVLFLLVPFVLYTLYSAARHDLRFDHLAVLAIVATLAFVGPRSRELMRGLYPIGLVFIVYDGMRPFQRVGLTAERVHLCDLRGLEVRMFGSNGSTIHDYWQAHHVPVLDLLCAIPYATFILWCGLGAVYLYVKNRAAMHRFMWGFFLMNVAAFITYHVIPAAPPWYFHSHGCVVDLATRASEGPALARVDQMLHIGYFHGMYSKASSVFGAVPSLHCAYPLLLAIEGWRAFGTKLRVLAVVYFLFMVFSAVYLDHHWLIDAVVGSLFAVFAAALMRTVQMMRETPSAADRLASIKRSSAWLFATWFGAGRSRIAPGTMGTLATLPLYLVVRAGGPIAIFATAIAVTVIGLVASAFVVRDSGEKDPQRIVIDEAAGVLVALSFAPQTWLGVGLAVLLFRVFDITKPFPARRSERLPGAWGVMVDDLVAGAWAAAVLMTLVATGVLQKA